MRLPRQQKASGAQQGRSHEYCRLPRVKLLPEAVKSCSTQLENTRKLQRARNRLQVWSLTTLQAVTSFKILSLGFSF